MLIDLPERVRWPAVLDALQAAGVSNSELARRARIGKMAVSKIKHGAEPLFCNGLAILRVYVDVIQRLQGSG